MNVMDWVKRLYAGCGLESDALELASLLNEIVDAYHSGDIDEGALFDYADKLCDTIVSHMDSCGKSYDKQKCIDELVKLVKHSPGKAVFRALRESLRRRRRGSSESGTGLGIVG